MGSVIKVLLIEDNRIEARQTQHWLNAAGDPPFEVECVDQLQAGLARLVKGGIDIVLLDLNLPDSRGLDTFIKLHEHAPAVPVVVLTGEFDEDVGPLAVEQGAQDYLIKQQVDGHILARVIRHGLARHRAQLRELGTPQRGRTVKVVGFIGAKGGVGTTTTALNIALALGIQGKPAILVELHPSFGTLSCHLNRNPNSSLTSILKLPPEKIDSTGLEAELSQAPAGLRVLFGPQQAKDSQTIEPNQAEAIIKVVSRMTEYVILDLPAQPSPATHAAIRLCNSVVVVTEREPASVAAGKVLVSQLQTWGIGGDVVGAIIVNRTVYPITMEIAEVQAGLGCAIVGIVPWAATACLRALREGSPLVVSQRDNEASINLADIATKIAAGKLTSLNL